RRILKILPAMLAVTHARAIPAIDEDAIDAIARHDLALYLGHELEIVRPKPARDPHLRRRPMPARLALDIDRDPVGMGLLHVIISGMRNGSCDHDHPEFPAAAHQFAKWI